MIRELLEDGSVMDIIATFIALALIASLFLCLLFIIWGGITFILSAGNEEKIKQAVHTIRYAIIGFAFTIGAFFIVSILSKFFDIPFELDFSTIMDLMRDIFGALSE